MNLSNFLVFLIFLDNCQNNICNRDGILNPGRYLESRNGKHRLISTRSGLLLNCGSTTIWRERLYNSDKLYFDLDGLSLVFGMKKYRSKNMFYTSVTIWKAGTEGRANKLVLQDNGNLVLKNGCNKTIWETKTNGACPPGL